MPDPPTHYQLSFTSRQALGVFIGLLLALGAAYFLGVMTGLAGRGSAKTATVATPAPTAPVRIAAAQPLASPTPIRPLRGKTPTIPPFPKPVLGREPTAAAGLQFFEDRAESETPPSTTKPATPRPTASKSPSPPPKPSTAVAATGEFWVQVTSVRSEREARARRDKLIRRGYRARILPGEGSQGKLYRVRVGPYSSRDEASRASERLSREEKIKTWIVPTGK